MRLRSEVVTLARSWVGKKESDNTHREIVDIYNSLPKEQRPRNVTMQYSWPWCACTWSAIAIKLGYTSIMPIEISCGNLINEAKKMGCWVENDAYIPKPGDAVLYDWSDSGVGDNIGWPDHIGIVEYVNEDSGYFVVIEGNYEKSVKRREMMINGRYIRGFITPKYDEIEGIEIPEEPNEGKSLLDLAKEVIVGKWGSGQTRRDRLTAAGYNYREVQDLVNEILNGETHLPKEPDKPADQDMPTEKTVTAAASARSKDVSLKGKYRTTANLHCRDGAGTNKKSLCVIPKGTKVDNYGFYTLTNGTRWLFIQFKLDGVQYTGFSSEKYLERV